VVDSSVWIGTQLLTNLGVHVPPKASEEFLERLAVFGQHALQERLKSVDVQHGQSLSSGRCAQDSCHKDWNQNHVTRPRQAVQATRPVFGR
jgi:hypothetical protein